MPVPVTPPSFVVARNPDPDSSLPYLIRVPVGGDPLVLKAGDRWPRTAKVYCHRAPRWPDDAEVVDEVPVRTCTRRGPAIDLVLARPRENRSQLVFTRLRGDREAIFWQTARTTRQARPGLRVPTRRASGWPTLPVLVDTRERYPYRFTRLSTTTERRALAVGDYGVESDGEVVAAVERKSLADLAKGLVDGSISYQLAALAGVWRAAVVGEARHAELYKLERVRKGFVPDLLARVQVRYPTVPIVFCETRPLAEQWVYRFLGAALAEALAQESPPDDGSVWDNGATVSRPGGRGPGAGNRLGAEEGRGSAGQGAG